MFCTSKDGINFENFRLDVDYRNSKFQFYDSIRGSDQFQSYIYSNDITVYVQPNFIVSDLFTYFEAIFQKNPFCFFVCINQNQRQSKTKFFYTGVTMFEDTEVLQYLKNVFSSYKDALPKNKYSNLVVTFLFKEEVDFLLNKLVNVCYTEVDRRTQFQFEILEAKSKLLFKIASIYGIPTIPHFPMHFRSKDTVIFENKLYMKKVIILQERR